MISCREGALVLALVAGPIAAAELSLLRSFPFLGPSGLEYDSGLCALWVASERRELVLINLRGDELRRFATDLSRIDAVAIDGDGLLLTDGSGTYQRTERRGTTFGPLFRLGAEAADNDGLYVDTVLNGVWIADDTAHQILRSVGGSEPVPVIDGMALTPPMEEPQGITRDPVSGHFLVVDDADGLDSLFEFGPEGTLLDVIPLANGGIADAEGISMQPETATLFIAFDDTNVIAVYHFVPTPAPAPASSAPVPPGACIVSTLRSDLGPG